MLEMLMVTMVLSHHGHGADGVHAHATDYGLAIVVVASLIWLAVEQYRALSDKE